MYCGLNQNAGKNFSKFRGGQSSSSDDALNRLGTYRKLLFTISSG